jgi:hypothetical protein
MSNEFDKRLNFLILLKGQSKNSIFVVVAVAATVVLVLVLVLVLGAPKGGFL